MPDNHYLQDSSSQPAPVQTVHGPVLGQPAKQRLKRLEQLLICCCQMKLRGATRPNSFLLHTDVTKDGPVACPFTQIVFATTVCRRGVSERRVKKACQTACQKGVSKRRVKKACQLACQNGVSKWCVKRVCRTACQKGMSKRRVMSETNQY